MSTADLVKSAIEYTRESLMEDSSRGDLIIGDVAARLRNNYGDRFPDGDYSSSARRAYRIVTQKMRGRSNANLPGLD